MNEINTPASPEDIKVQLDAMNIELQSLKRTNPAAYLELLNKLNALLEELNSEFETK